MPARSRQRSSPQSPKLELPWAPTPRQELVDAQAEADIAHRRAETRDLEGKTAREDRREDAEIAFLEASTVRIWLLNLLPPLLVALTVIIGSVDSGALAGSGYDLLGNKLWLLSKLIGDS